MLPALNECRIASCPITNFNLERHSLESRVDLETAHVEAGFDDQTSEIALSFPSSFDMKSSLNSFTNVGSPNVICPHFSHSGFKILSQSSFFGKNSMFI